MFVVSVLLISIIMIVIIINIVVIVCLVGPIGEYLDAHHLVACEPTIIGKGYRGEGSGDSIGRNCAGAEVLGLPVCSGVPISLR